MGAVGLLHQIDPEVSRSEVSPDSLMVQSNRNHTGSKRIRIQSPAPAISDRLGGKSSGAFS